MNIVSDTPEPFDPDTGELLETRAADGGQRYPAARSLAEYIRMLEDGQFDADVAYDMKQLVTELEELAETTGQGRLKAKLTIQVEITRDPSGFYVSGATYNIKKPAQKRRQTVMWVTDDGAFTPNKPNQGNLFGNVRVVTPTREVRTVDVAPTRDIRTI